MEKTKHTPGPWRKGIPSDSIISDNPIFFKGTSRDTKSDLLKYYGGYVICESVAPQNINIIIAAPDLLEACKRALAAEKALPEGMRHPELEQALEGTIAKAEAQED